MRITLSTIALLIGLSLVLPVMAAEDTSVGDTSFMGYEGKQDWPTNDKAQVIKDYAVPIYVGFPTKHYKVLGRIYDARTQGIEIIGRAFDEGLNSEKNRMRSCANQAKKQGGDAVLVTDDEKLISAFKLSKEDLERTTPLFEHKDKITLAIKFN